MSSWSESLEYFEHPMAVPMGPLERLWQSETRETVVLSAAELSRRERDAHIEGVHQTEARLNREYEAALSNARSEFLKALVGLQEQRSEYFRKMEGEVVRLALAVGRTVVERELEANPVLLQPAVREVLERIDRGSKIRVRVPQHTLEAWQGTMAREFGDFPGLEIAGEEELASGRCAVETVLGTTDFDIAGRLNEIERSLLRDDDALRDQGPTVVQ
ncbi:MAG: FliH/SctL family protein [Acidobacteriaceae bacterium]